MRKKKLVLALLATLASGVILVLVFFLKSHQGHTVPVNAGDQALVWQEKLTDAGFVPSGPIIFQGTTVVASISGVIVRFTSEKDVATQIRALQILSSRIKMDSKSVQEIDLRFNNPVIKY